MRASSSACPPHPPEAPSLAAHSLSRVRPILWLYAFAPVALLLELLGASAALVFAGSALAIVPAAATMGEATEELARRSGPGIGGLVNVTFGNAPELIIALFALTDGLQEVVKASLVGSIVGNALLVMGASMLAGGWGRERQRFHPTAARALAGMLLLTVLALGLPSMIEIVRGSALPGPTQVRRPVAGDVEGVSYAGGMTFVILKVVNALVGLRVKEHAEEEGLDISQHGELAYDLY